MSATAAMSATGGSTEMIVDQPILRGTTAYLARARESGHLKPSFNREKITDGQKMRVFRAVNEIFVSKPETYQALTQNVKLMLMSTDERTKSADAVNAIIGFLTQHNKLPQAELFTLAARMMQDDIEIKLANQLAPIKALAPGLMDSSLKIATQMTAVKDLPELFKRFNMTVQ